MHLMELLNTENVDGHLGRQGGRGVGERIVCAGRHHSVSVLFEFLKKHYFYGLKRYKIRNECAFY